MSLIGNYKEIAYKETPDGCWECTSHSLDKGYPKFTRENRKWFISRWMYTQNIGPIPEGMIVRHKCDNPMCINPTHLELGTPYDNSADMVARGRSTVGKQWKNKSRIPLEKIKEIKKALKDPIKKSYATIGKKFGVSKNTVMSISKGWTWSDI
jgi:hypothetical protein